MATLKSYKQVIKKGIESNDEFLCKSLVMVYELQTPSEQNWGVTAEQNGVGFTGVDAEFLSSLAKQYIERGSLSPKQLPYARKKMAKYAGQLSRIAKSMHG
tara:strand:- start:2965 stop:3267 length:303 start_codon:yes stop_codon:yes gene_type:complete